MSPEQAISALDRALASHGQTITLRRTSGEGTSQTNADVSVRVREGLYTSEELASGLYQGQTRIILSPSEILAASWPSPQSWPATGDFVVIEGRERRVESATLRRIDGTVVRIELEVVG